MNLNITAEWFVSKEALEAGKEIRAGSRACNCIGPQKGQPLCPCMMTGVTIEDGRYVQKRDLGPAPSASGGIRTNKGEVA
ncbi:hypothetical protein AB3480_00540 [Rhizobium mongolense]|uniref:hypothetical protein n=1 Tax=Rhizobium mongolense TaxID=57676 RepID=UPI0034A42E4A